MRTQSPILLAAAAGLLISLAACSSDSGNTQAGPSTTTSPAGSSSTAPSADTSTPGTSTPGTDTSSSGQSSGTGTESPASTAAGTHPAAGGTAAAAATQVVKLDPLTPSGAVRRGFRLDKSGASTRISCYGDQGAIAGLTRGTHWCGATADSCADAVTSPQYPASILCLNSASDPTLRLRPAADVKEVGVPKKPIPLEIQTADGSHWIVRVGGAGGSRKDDLRDAYYCTSGPCQGQRKAVLTAPNGPEVDKSSAQWTVQVGTPGGTDTPVRVGVTKAWFLVNSAA